MPVQDDPNDSGQTAALLRGRRPGRERERDELNARLHLEELRAHFAKVAPAPVHFRKWTVLRKLGQGGMGTVYLAENPALGRKVALKLVGDTDEGSARDTAREARALAAVHHARVIQVYSVDDASPPVVVIEMEYVDGETLRRWAAHPQRGWRALVGLIAGIGDGLAELHRAGLIHRDVKPDNILVSSSGEGKLADFGLAVAADRAPADTGPGDAHGSHAPAEKATPLELRMTANGALLGTLGYIAPEVMAGDEATPSSDLFGLASVLYEGLYGTLPFAGDSPAELAEAIQTGRLSAPHDAPKLPSWLLRALRRALSADPAARHPSVADFVRALRRGLRWRRLVMIAGGLLLTMAALPVAGWYLGPPPPDPCAHAGEAIAALVDGDPRASGTSLLQATLVGRRDAWSDADLKLCATARRRPLFDLQGIERDLRRRGCLDESLATITALLGPSHGPVGDTSVQASAELVAAIEAVPTCDDALLARWRPGQRGTRAKLDAALRHELAGEDDEAERLARAIAEGDHPAHERAEALYRLGHVLGDERRVREATAALEQARDLAFASGHDDLYCRVAAYQAKLAANVALSPEASQRDLRAATACMERTGSRSPILQGDLIEARGLLAHIAGELDLEIELHEQALSLRSAQLGEAHPDVTKSHHNLATALAARASPEDRLAAQEHYKAAVARSRELASDAPPLADVLLDLAALQADIGRDAQAKAHLEEALAIYERSDGQHHASLAKIHTTLAYLALGRDDFEDSASQLAQARQLHALADLPADHNDRLLRLHAEGTHAALMGDLSTAEELYREALDLRREELSEDELDVLIEWIEAAYSVGKSPELAARTLAAGPPLLDRLRAESDARRGGTLAWYAAAGLQTAARPREAIPFLRAALAAYESLPEPPLDLIAELRWELAKGLAQASPAESRALAEAAREAYGTLGDRTNVAITSRWLRERSTAKSLPSLSTTSQTHETE